MVLEEGSVVEFGPTVDLLKRRGSGVSAMVKLYSYRSVLTK